MAPVIKPVQTSADIPQQTTVAIIGGGIVGLSASLALAERGIPNVVLEKGRIAAEQSSRNLGWVRKTNRSAADLPLSIASERLWQEMQQRTGAQVGYRQRGIMFLARTETELEASRLWLDSVKGFSLDSRMLTPTEIDLLVPGGREKWAGGVYTASDGYAEPTLASSAIAAAAIAKGSLIVENCAVRTLSLAAGRVASLITERGEIRCQQVLLAGAMWSRRFLGNLGISLPTLPVSASVIRTAPMDGPTEIAVGAPDFSFRKHQDGGFIITQRGAMLAPLTMDHLRIGLKYLPTLRANRRNIRISLGREFLADLSLARSWTGERISPFERMRIMDPVVNQKLIAEAMTNLAAAWPVFGNAAIRETWAGSIDITPDSLPVISAVANIPGLTLATGFSGHGFGTGPGAGQLAADLVTGGTPLVDPAPYRLERLYSAPGHRAG
ncbi:FAD-binding oxidoreductase [Paracoccus sp. MKU1]|uniref:NAD(P)/FAD-dependent oxidoreductase n=1 Tax=Paracoccus sp. MKU1 TaxID=1745182 RepID=UPI0007192CA1|nr:FAD-binding oxidoreductase [Paracoccus sp. MKU1]KRW95215.1 D-amino acid oxidase [Paracoccus sp. MKU1]